MLGQGRGEEGKKEVKGNSLPNTFTMIVVSWRFEKLTMISTQLGYDPACQRGEFRINRFCELYFTCSFFTSAFSESLRFEQIRE